MAEIQNFDHVQWHHSALGARLGLGFGSVDASVFAAILIFLAHMSWPTLIVSLSIIVVMSVLEYFDYPPLVAVRRSRALMAGRRRYVMNTRARRRRLANG